jgi:hypothetical protein
MENKFQTSFIPKNSLDNGHVKIKTPLNVLFLVSMVIVTLTILSAGGVFGYSLFLSKRIDSLSKELAIKEKTFDYDKVEEIVRVDNKLDAAAALLESHTAVSGVFAYLEENTLKNLRFNDFEYSYISPTRVSVAMRGQARTFGAVAKQAELFSTASKQSGLNEPIFSDLDLDENGNVTFSFLADVDPTLISYENNLPSASASVPATTPTPVSTSTHPTVQ